MITKLLTPSQFKKYEKYETYKFLNKNTNDCKYVCLLDDNKNLVGAFCIFDNIEELDSSIHVQINGDIGFKSYVIVVSFFIEKEYRNTFSTYKLINYGSKEVYDKTKCVCVITNLTTTAKIIFRKKFFEKLGKREGLQLVYRLRIR